MSHRSVKIGLLALCAAIASCAPSLEREFCQAGLDCVDPERAELDPVLGESEDSVEVCIATVETSQAALRANTELECSDIADARADFMACAVDNGCDAFVREGPCGDEHDRFTRLVGETQNRCNE